MIIEVIIWFIIAIISVYSIGNSTYSQDIDNV